MAGDPYSKIVNAMRKEGEYNKGYNMELATVKTVKPLSIVINDLTISSGLYCNKMYLMTEKIEELLANEECLKTPFKDCLKDVYNNLKFDTGDKVAVQRVGNNFYVLGKVVQL